MAVNAENLRYILGFKLRQFRQKKGYALKDLAERTNVSISFLSEIEKGKKYPKPEKIMQLAQALDISFDDLVSLKVDQELDAVTSLLDSPLLKEFPFELFGITPRDLLDLMTDSPNKAGAFLRTFLEIGQSYDMRVEHFLLAALRSYQKMHLNYFEDIENAVFEFCEKHKWQAEPPVSFEQLQAVFMRKYGYGLIESTFEDYPELKGFRSIWLEGQPQKLVINKNLLPIQKAFVLGRAIGYAYLGLEERAKTSTWLKIESFEQVLNNFKASYFAGALLINRDILRKGLAEFFKNKRWDGDSFLQMMKKYAATPEMFLYRLSQIIPKFFGLHEIFYLRFNNEAGSDHYHLTKELNLSRVLAPHGIGLNEHYCRRWLGLSLLRELAHKQGKNTSQTIIAAQRSQFIENDSEFFTITLARPLALSESTNSSISLGFLINKEFKNKVRFWNDVSVQEVEVNETCERCRLTLSECSERVVPAAIYEHEQQQVHREEVLNQFMEDMKGNA